MLGLPTVTALFVFGGFFAAIILSVVYALTLQTEGEEWLTLDDWRTQLRRRSG